MWNRGGERRGWGPGEAGKAWLFSALVFAVLYLTFLIVRYEWQDVQRNLRLADVRSQIETMTRDIALLRQRLALLQTNAYRDRFNKQTQNRKDPFEDVTVIVDEALAKNYPGIDIDRTVTATRTPGAAASPTVGMTPAQKWVFYLTRGEVR